MDSLLSKKIKLLKDIHKIDFIYFKDSDKPKRICFFCSHYFFGGKCKMKKECDYIWKLRLEYERRRMDKLEEEKEDSNIEKDIRD